MPTFQFEAMDSTGAEIKDVIDAATEEDAQATIRQMGYFVTKISVKKARKKAEAGGDPEAARLISLVSSPESTPTPTPANATIAAATATARQARRRRVGAIVSTLTAVASSTSCGATEGASAALASSKASSAAAMWRSRNASSVGITASVARTRATTDGSSVVVSGVSWGSVGSVSEVMVL